MVVVNTYKKACAHVPQYTVSTESGDKLDPLHLGKYSIMPLRLRTMIVQHSNILTTMQRVGLIASGQACYPHKYQSNLNNALCFLLLLLVYFVFLHVSVKLNWNYDHKREKK